MSSNQDKGVSSGRIEASDDVEGHGARTTHIDGPDAEDVEGHAIRGKAVVADEDDDVEGHKRAGG